LEEKKEAMCRVAAERIDEPYNQTDLGKEKEWGGARNDYL